MFLLFFFVFLVFLAGLIDLPGDVALLALVVTDGAAHHTVDEGTGALASGGAVGDVATGSARAVDAVELDGRRDDGFATEGGRGC